MSGSISVHGRTGAHRRRWGIVVAVVALAVVGCNATTSSSDPGSPGPTTGVGGSGAPSGDTAGVPGDCEVVAAIDNLGSQEWAPHLAFSDTMVSTMVLGNFLTEVNTATGEVVGQLAESWELSDDAKTWTFKLKPDIPFHDGWGTVTAEDVRYTWSQIIRPEANYGFGVSVKQAIDNNMDNFEVVDDLTFKLHTENPVVYLPSVVSQNSDGPVIRSAKYHAESPDADSHPIGTGSFKYVSNTPGVEVVFEAVPNHWKHTPACSKLTLKEIPDPTARLLQVQSGEVDIALLNAGLLNEARATDGVTVQSVPEIGNGHIVLGGQYWGTDKLDRDAPWIQADAPEKGRAIRQALSLALDRATILERVLFGDGVLAHCALFQYPSTPSHVDPSWSLPAFDLELAKQKLAEGGYQNGFPIEIQIYDQKVGTAGPGEAVAGMWEDLGLQVTRNVTDENAWGPTMDAQETAGKAWVDVRGWFPEVGFSLVTVHPSREDAKFLDPVWTAAYDAMASEPDKAARDTLGRELCAGDQTEVRAIPLFTMGMPYALGPEVGSWSPISQLDHISGLETVTPAN
jgi:ABC-type transport system substrate-binding protein